MIIDDCSVKSCDVTCVDCNHGKVTGPCHYDGKFGTTEGPSLCGDCWAGWATCEVRC